MLRMPFGFVIFQFVIKPCILNEIPTFRIASHYITNNNNHSIIVCAVMNVYLCKSASHIIIFYKAASVSFYVTKTSILTECFHSM